jgi:hypothetical protein
MELWVHDNQLTRVALVSNDHANAIHYAEDEFHTYLTEGTSTFSFTAYKNVEAYQKIDETAYLSFRYKNRDYLFSVMQIEEDEQTMRCFCEALNLELLHEQETPFEASEAHDIAWYLADIITYGALEIGRNEVSHKNLKLSWEGTDTALGRALSIANKFDAELEFVTELNSDGSLKRLRLDIYEKNDGAMIQGVGERRNDLKLSYGRNVKTITRTIDKSNIFNMIVPTGTNGLTITDKVESVYNEQGIEEFYTRAGNGAIYAPLSVEKYPSHFNQNTSADTWIRHDWTYETESVNTLYGQALAELRKNCYPAITYEVDGYFDLNIGDTVRIEDSKFDPILLIEARVSEQILSFTNPTKNKTVFANFRALEDRTSDLAKQRAQQLAEENAPYRFDISTTTGTVFQNGTGTTTIRARVYKGKSVQPIAVGEYAWYINDALLNETGSEATITSEMFTGTAEIRYVAKIGGLSVGGASLSISNITTPTVDDPAWNDRMNEIVDTRVDQEETKRDEAIENAKNEVVEQINYTTLQELQTRDEQMLSIEQVIAAQAAQDAVRDQNITDAFNNIEDLQEVINSITLDNGEKFLIGAMKKNFIFSDYGFLIQNNPDNGAVNNYSILMTGDRISFGKHTALYGWVVDGVKYIDAGDGTLRVLTQTGVDSENQPIYTETSDTLANHPSFTQETKSEKPIHFDVQEVAYIDSVSEKLKITNGQIVDHLQIANHTFSSYEVSTDPEGQEGRLHTVVKFAQQGVG